MEGPGEDSLHLAGISSLKQGPMVLRDNETMQGDKFFSLSDHSSWSSNEQLDLEAGKTSSEFDSEVSSSVLGKETHESSKNATTQIALIPFPLRTRGTWRPVEALTANSHRTRDATCDPRPGNDALRAGAVPQLD
ncbi:hypothetical protein NDU88_001371 [Pleurodeles waltl]|uniref:Uncharacterized protein n=1 Tax=Pleurodeles waltl TaxID=8319 RepID=A0AAV7THL7_PLEWA|nr:hypothetical protein NDU88_001371 [Pleurodeles waltl]